jgi:hypothetical protein
MPYQPSHRTAAATYQPPMDADELDALLLDDDADDFLDHHVTAIRESQTDFLDTEAL